MEKVAGDCACVYTHTLVSLESESDRYKQINCLSVFLCMCISLLLCCAR